MKIKIIDLLNMNENKLPNRIKVFNTIFEIVGKNYYATSGDYENMNLLEWVHNIDDLNEQVEIIEENDSFTGVKFFSNGNCFFGVDTSGELKPKDGVVVDSKIEKIDINRMLQTKKWKRDKNAWKKINELIDEVNKLKEKL